ncbi:S41 family peptidase [Acanthopleuribacter pedis]|uniref:Tail specific protease domain-containing protein n=1 Tax=Acanthopleuribacter pedis TaxID=442870 RepID=A0A8J7U665_9BACT|nr:S41 family peptidase [Acanthopleuribacter pedis]MBO1322457.1 hypothetical protein [Acanthopleuribacter pedis]
MTQRCRPSAASPPPTTLPRRRRGNALIPVILVLFMAAFWPSHAADKENLASFDKVWSTIKEKHWNLEKTGVDWIKIGETYRPKAKKTSTRGEMRKVIRAMISELGQSHFNVYGGDGFATLETALGDFTRGGNGTLGFEVALVDDRLLVTRVHKNVLDAESGIQIGTEILAHSGKKLKPVIDDMTELYGDMAQGRLYMNRTLNSLFEDSPGMDKELTTVTNGKEQTRTFKMHPPLGRPKTILNLPTVHYEYQSEVMSDNIGYLTFNIFIPDVKTQFDNETLPSFKETDGMIIDLRGNGGGIGFIAVALSNRILSQQSKLGTMSNQGGTLNFAVFPQKPIYDKPIAILIDGGSASTSEIMAAGLQDLKRAKVFGTRSAGAALPSIIETLPNGDRFQYAIADYTSVGGRHVEGNGVEPDEVTPHTATSLKAGKDAALEAARQWIKSGGQL